MKKLFLVGALAASMAFSSSALAAVNYGEDLTTGIAGTLNEDGTISVTTNIKGSTAGQLTILVLDEENPETIEYSNIMYIDQATVTGTSDATVFENMGLLNPNNVETAYVRVGSDMSIGILTTSVALVEEDVVPEYTLGDVDDNGYITMSDAACILNHYTDKEPITDENRKLAADVDTNGYITMSDAAGILNHYTGKELIVQPN